MSRKNIPEKEMKALIANSGGVCAFPGCAQRFVEPGNAVDDAAFLGEMAHIVADSRQGPRGNSPMSDEDRYKHTNLLLLCGDHHKVIDSQPRTYSVSVLRRMKDDHEGRIRRATGGTLAPDPAPLTREVIHSSLLAVTRGPPAGAVGRGSGRMRHRRRRGRRGRSVRGRTRRCPCRCRGGTRSGSGRRGAGLQSTAP